MRIKDALKLYTKVEIDLLLSFVLGKSREFLFMNLGYILTSKHLNILSKFIKRREKGEPMAYILGYKDFYGLRFKVNRDVLIPRPETEMVVDLVIHDVVHAPGLLRRQPKGLHYKPTIQILDLGTGSGNIIISLAKALPPSPSPSHQGRGIKQDSLPLVGRVREGGYEFYGSDISSAALKVAQQNAKIHHAKIKFIKSDLLKNIKPDFDIVIANLPYGWRGWKNRFSAVKDGLKFEPQKALFTREYGLMLIRHLLEQIAKRKNQPKIIYIEFDPRQKSDLQMLIKKYLPGKKIKFFKDFNNFWRYAEIR